MSRFARKLRRDRNKKAKVLKKIRKARDEASKHKRSKVNWTLKKILKELPYSNLERMSMYGMTNYIFVNMRFNPRVREKLFEKVNREVTRKK